MQNCLRVATRPGSGVSTMDRPNCFIDPSWQLASMDVASEGGWTTEAVHVELARLGYSVVEMLRVTWVFRAWHAFTRPLPRRYPARRPAKYASQCSGNLALFSACPGVIDGRKCRCFGRRGVAKSSQAEKSPGLGAELKDE